MAVSIVHNLEAHHLRSADHLSEHSQALVFLCVALPLWARLLRGVRRAAVSRGAHVRRLRGVAAGDQVSVLRGAYGAEVSVAVGGGRW